MATTSKRSVKTSPKSGPSKAAQDAVNTAVEAKREKPKLPLPDKGGMTRWIDDDLEIFRRILTDAGIPCNMQGASHDGTERKGNIVLQKANGKTVGKVRETLLAKFPSLTYANPDYDNTGQPCWFAITIGGTDLILRLKAYRWENGMKGVSRQIAVYVPKMTDKPTETK